MTVITINNWTEFNPRKDRKEHHWFRVDNSIPFSRALDGMAADQKWFWICLLAFASKNNGSPIEYDVPYFEKHVGMSKKKMDEALGHLERKSVITIESDTERLPSGNHMDTERCSTYVRTYEHTNMGSAEPASPGFDFEGLYQTYPRKRGKDEGMLRLRARIKTQEQFDLFAKAVRKYAKECRMERTEPTKMLYWSSFIGTGEKQPWRDHIEPPATKPTIAIVPQEPQEPVAPLTDDQRAQLKAQLAKIGRIGSTT